jgi:hypothetical protein
MHGGTQIMQISRHWRLNPQRYRLQGVRYGNGDMSLQTRPVPANTEQTATVRDVAEKDEKVALKAAS